MLGSPSVMRDDDISIPFPGIKPVDESQNAFAIHAILSSHLGKILDGELHGLYRVNGRLSRCSQPSMECTINSGISFLK
jgi:hypothetical protein